MVQPTQVAARLVTQDRTQAEVQLLMAEFAAYAEVTTRVAQLAVATAAMRLQAARMVVVQMEVRPVEMIMVPATEAICQSRRPRCSAVGARDSRV